MFIGLDLSNVCGPAERHVLCYVQLHAAPTERDNLVTLGL